MIAPETNPWLQGPDGDPINLAEIPVTALTSDCDCADSPTAGVMAAMDSAEGIQRCDTCQRFGSDLEAARALAHDLSERTGKELSVWFTPAPDPSSGRVRVRSDGRFEVADEGGADVAYGCRVDDDCVLADDHDGDCNADREVWAGPDSLYKPMETPEWLLAEYEMPREEDYADAQEVSDDTPEAVERRAVLQARLRAAERMFADGYAHPGDEIFEHIWETDEGGHGERTVRHELSRIASMREGLATGTIRPREIIGTGYRGNTRKLANEWLDEQQTMFEKALMVRGRNLTVNAANVDYRLRH